MQTSNSPAAKPTEDEIPKERQQDVCPYLDEASGHVRPEMLRIMVDKAVTTRHVGESDREAAERAVRMCASEFRFLSNERLDREYRDAIIAELVNLSAQDRSETAA